MKKLYFLALAALLFACSADETIDANANGVNGLAGKRPQNDIKNTVAPNNVLMLKIDFLTQQFEGGTVLQFAPSNGFTIASDYESPLDFGGITLRYAQTNQMLFSGSIIWMGLGHMSFPAGLQPAASFATGAAVPLPNAAQFEIVDYGGYYPDPLPHASIWDAVDNLQLVAQYRAANPNANVRVFLYTPSVGVGNPEDWDYFVMIKN